MAALTGQDVVGAAGCRRIHGFNANTAGRQAHKPGGLGEVQAQAAAKHDQLRIQCSQLVKVDLSQVAKAFASPVKALPPGSHD